MCVALEKKKINYGPFMYTISTFPGERYLLKVHKIRVPVQRQGEVQFSTLSVGFLSKVAKILMN